MKEVIIYTDGFCEPNPGEGGWAAILLFGSARRELCGAEDSTTNNRMELTAAIKGLEALKVPCTVSLFTDSQYVGQGVTQWMPNWKSREWLTYARKPVMNQDLWQQLDELTQMHQMTWHWVKGHAGDPLNERCDYLAARASHQHQTVPCEEAETGT